MIKKGDIVTPTKEAIRKNPSSFWWRNLPVERVVINNLSYAGNAFVYVKVNGKEEGFYASYLEVINHKNKKDESHQ